MTRAVGLIGKVAIVTGGGAGLGRACACAFAEQGADVVIADIEPSRCEEVAERVVELGRRGLPITTDVMETEQINAMVAEADKLSAGSIFSSTTWVACATRRFSNKARVAGVVISTSTWSVCWPPHRRPRRSWCGAAKAAPSSTSPPSRLPGPAPNVAVYAACKAGMVSFTKSMALELSEHEIRVNCVSPDHTLTPGSRGNRTGPVDPSKWTQRTDEQQDKLNRLIPLRREGTDKEFAAVVAFLASDQAAYITGINLPVDGGTDAAAGWHRGSKGQWTQLEGWRPDR